MNRTYVMDDEPNFDENDYEYLQDLASGVFHPQRPNTIQGYFDAYWASNIEAMDIIWEALSCEDRYFVETRGCAPWQ